MLFAEPTRYGAGVTLWGDPHDLHHLRDTIYDLADGEALGHQLAGLLLRLAYEVRHAYQRDRLERSIGLDELDAVDCRGCQILWPYFLVQVSLLRHAASYRPTTAGHQADIYRLEAVTHAALVQFDAEAGRRCLDSLVHIGHLPKDYLTTFIGLQAREFVTGPGGKARFARLPALIRRLSWLRTEYREYQQELEVIAEEKGCQPHDLEDRSDWPDFRW